ncbi:immunity 49 family protein [Archangium violaceum]|uniref:Imm49 family immunity protein n=1 Tax=Archangium violaceum TaxID=83451 RepID=UPI00193C23F0|nr:Imm49 family immunity protein [Archangium violaceum]QRK12594.1 immunity 49 family protein [Archangium violaceum]
MNLETVRENAHVYLMEALDSISQRTADEQSGLAYITAAYFYRRIAICELLAEARMDRFATFLAKSALVRIHFLRLVTQGHAAAPLHTCASRNFSFVDSLVAGQLHMAVELARLTPDRHTPSIEYEDDFLLHRFLQRLTLHLHVGDNFDLAAMLERWETVLEGEYDPYLGACKALLQKDTRALNEALRDAIAIRKRSFQDEKKQSVPPDRRLTEGFVFMDGLAFLRLAETLGMPVQREYPTIPKFARIPLGRAPLPHDSWMRPEQAVPA